MSRIEIIKPLHLSTTRDYAARRNDPGRAHNCTVAKKFGPGYWDGDRKYGYGGYHYDGRWRPVAEALMKRYFLDEGSRVLDLGCGKGFLLYELTKIVPALVVEGIDISRHAVENAHPAVREFIREGRIEDIALAQPDFDLVISINAIHNLGYPAVRHAVSAANILGAGSAYIAVESWDTEQERLNLLDWQLTCESFYSPTSWQEIGRSVGYRGDWEFITFP